MRRDFPHEFVLLCVMHLRLVGTSGKSTVGIPFFSDWNVVELGILFGRVQCNDWDYPVGDGSIDVPARVGRVGQ